MARLAALILPFALSCTSSSFQSSVFRQGNLAYRVGSLPLDWRRISVGDANLAFRHKDGGTLVANAMCKDQIEDVPLDVLTNDLFFGIDKQKEISRQTFELDGRAAMRTRTEGTLDGVPISVDAVVLKKDGCTFDFQLVGSAAEVTARDQEFTAFFTGFAKVSGP